MVARHGPLLRPFASVSVGTREPACISLVLTVLFSLSLFLAAAASGSIRAVPVRSTGSTGQATPTGPINYYGGSVLVGNPTVNVYLIYYGAWSKGAATNAIENFVASLSSDSGAQGGASDATVKNWWAISAGYYMTSGSSSVKSFVSSKVRLAGTVYDTAYSVGKGTLSPGSILTLVKGKVGAGKLLAYDANGVYLVVVGKDVTVTGFGSLHCGWHSKDQLSASQPLLYALAADAANYLNKCASQTTSPNGLPGIDAAISNLAHTLAEVATNPDCSTGWHTVGSAESGDLCAWSYGSTQQAFDSRGVAYSYNLVGLNGAKYLVQQVWDRAGQQCALQGNLPSVPVPAGVPPMSCQCTCTANL